MNLLHRRAINNLYLFWDYGIPCPCRDIIEASLAYNRLLLFSPKTGNLSIAFFASFIFKREGAMRMRQTLLVVTIMLILLLTATGVFADDPTAESNARAIDTTWIVISFMA